MTLLKQIAKSLLFGIAGGLFGGLMTAFDPLAILCFGVALTVIWFQTEREGMEPKR